MSENKRQTELDILRLLATLAVIMIHGGLNPLTDNLMIKYMYRGMHAAIVWCVPVFFMISGRFFLDPERDVSAKKILTVYLPHIIVPFLVWSGVYTAYGLISGSYSHLSTFGVIAEFIHGPYHLWFLYSLAGLYLLTPILRKAAADGKTLAYFLIMFAAVNVVTQYLIYVPKIGGMISDFIERTGLRAVTGYMGYFMLGYFLYSKKDNMSKKTETAIYVIGILMLIATIAAECFISEELRKTDFVKQYMKPNVILYSAAIYAFFVMKMSKIHYSERTRKVFSVFTECGFGVYCIHAILNEFVPTPVIKSLPFITSLLRVACLYALSLALIWLIRKIPFVGKKIT